MTPDKIIWALMLFGVLPSSFVNRSAAVVLFAFLLGYLAWRLGLPEPETQLAIYVGAIGIGIGFRGSLAHDVALAMFLPLAVAMIAWLMGWMTDVEAWNSAFWLTLMQIVAVPFGNDWGAIGMFVRKVARGLPANRMEMSLEPAR